VSTKENKPSSTSSLKQKLMNDEAEISMESPQSSEERKDSALLEHPSYLELQNKLTEAEAKANQYWDRMLRMQAETDNMKRRVERDIENAHKYGLEKFILELLPVIDSLERAIAHPTEEESGEGEGVLEGVKLTLKMLYNALSKFGIEQIDPLSQPFNPELHQAVSTHADPNVQSGTVLSVLQKGYLLNNRLIRPALVVVAKNT